PGLVLALAYSIGIVLMATLWPRTVYAGGEPLPVHDAALMPLTTLAGKLLPSVLLIASVLGGLYAGFFTATEAGATGAAVALVIAFVRRKLNLKSLWSVLVETGHVTVAVSFLII